MSKSEYCNSLHNLTHACQVKKEAHPSHSVAATFWPMGQLLLNLAFTYPNLTLTPCTMLVQRIRLYVSMYV